MRESGEMIHAAVFKPFVRPTIVPRSLEINLCGLFPFPCGDKSFRAAIFRFVRAKFNPCGQSAVPCEPAFVPCGRNFICAANIRFVRRKVRFSMVLA
jgi:hypothetical protein